MKKNRKILLAGGCSFTEHTQISICDSSLITDFPRWPKVLAEKLDMECVNLGRSGWSNQLISTSIFEYIMENPKKKIGLVCCLWTDYTRTSIYNMPEWQSIMNTPLLSSFAKKSDDLSFQTGSDTFRKKYKEVENVSDIMNLWRIGPDKFLDLLCYYVKSSHTEIKTIVENIIKNNIKIFHDLECMLLLRDIPYLYLQGPSPFFYQPHLKKDRELEKIYAPSNEQILFYLLKYEKYFNKEKFIGWPGYKKGGWYGAVHCGDWISEMDLHPNEKGHRTMANYFYKKVEELYPYLLQEGI